ncbi:MAG: hypothetical protein P8Z79_14605 [Sedimentisphaerales bacterium]|jgi:hypothetical protein
MERQVEQFIQSLSDLDLLEYTRTQTHLPEALEFAKVEMTERRLPAGRLAELEEQLQQRICAREEEAKARAAEPLVWEWRLAVFLCGLYLGLPVLVFVPTWLRLRREGARRKCSDMWHYALGGFCLQPILILARIPPWSWLAALI